MTFDYVSYSATNMPESKSPTLAYKEDRSIYDLHNTVKIFFLKIYFIIKGKLLIIDYQE
jgi:hypothetical protein